MSTQYLYRIQPVRNGFLIESTPEEDVIVAEHFQYLQRLTEKGIVLLAGRTLNTDASSFGIVVFEAESEDAARKLVRNDPQSERPSSVLSCFPTASRLWARDSWRRESGRCPRPPCKTP